MAKKLTTEEILSQIRKTDGGGDVSPGEPAASGEAAAPPAKPASSAAAPEGPAGILAAIRAGGAGAQPGEAAGEAVAKPAPAPAKASAAPKSPAGILAAIRGGGGSAAAGPAAAEPAASQQAAAEPVPAGDLPSVTEMLAEMKSGGKKVTAEAAPAATAATVKPTLRVPVRPAPKVVIQPSRRDFLLRAVRSPFFLAWTFFAATAGAWVLMLARFMFPNMIVEPPTTFKIGPPSDYPLGTVSTKWTAARGIWVVHTDQYKGKNLIYVLASVCTHLGCTPSWLEGEQKFKCPCHGSGFYINGMNFEGPAPRPLERVGVRLASDGTLEVDKAVKFQEEKGQWEDAKSFVDGSIA